MTDSSIHRVALAMVGTLLLLAGCQDSGKKQAIARATAAEASLGQAKAELATVKDQLAAAQKERDELKASVDNMMTSIATLKGDLATITQSRDQLQQAAGAIPTMKDQLAQLAKDKTAALAKATEVENLVSGLKSQLQGLEQKIASLQDANSELRATFDELKKKASQIPTITAAAQP